MRFERIRVRAFGALEDLDTGPEPLPSLVVVHAPNEGGKSTFFVLLSSLLYGFYPASRDGHPYSPWSGEDADADAAVRLSGDERVTVHRRLLASPWGRLVDDREEDLANRTVPWANHVRRELFDEVFALTLADLARVDEKRWPEIQDRLLGSLGAEDVRGAREVVREVEDEADALWRPDRRGKPRARALQRRLQELNLARQEARESDRRARATTRTLEARRQRLEELREERKDVRVLIERIRTLDPVRRRLERIREAEAAAGDPEKLEPLPPEPGARLAGLREREAELEAEIGGLGEEAERHRRAIEAMSDRDRAVLDEAAEIRALGKLAGQVSSDRSRIEALGERVSTLRQRIREAARELFERPWDEIDSDLVTRAPLGEIRARVGRFEEARDRVERVGDRLEDREREAPGEPSGGAGVAGVALAVAGIGAVLWASLGDRAPAWAAVGLGLALPGVYLLLRYRAAREGAETHARTVASLASERERTEEALEAARREVADAAGGLPLSGHHRESPSRDTVHLLERLQELLDRLDQAAREEASVQERVEAARRRLDAVVGRTGIHAPPGMTARAVALEQALEAASERRVRARTAEEALEAARTARARLEEERGEAASERKALEGRLRALGDGDAARGAEVARARLDAFETARVLRKELGDRHPDLADLRRRIREAEAAGETWTSDPETLVEAEDRAEALDREEMDLRDEIKDLEHQLERLAEETTLDQVEGEILAVEEELEEVRRRRDRLALLARIVRAADHRFRERNQPDLLRAAGRHLSAITDGRYRRLHVPETDLDGTLLLQGPGFPGPVGLDEGTPVSTGTREQVYLALRLAIVDHLDAGGEPLPLFLDEAFVNWDVERRERGFGLLAELSERRQIFVFTCHAPMARSLEERGARLIRLPGPE